MSRRNGDAAARFLTLEDIALARADHRAVCRVRLRHGDDCFEAEAVEPDSEQGRARAAARATLAAAEQAVANVTLGLEGVAFVQIFQRRYVAAAVEAASGRRTASLSGLVPIDTARSAEEAAAFAALHAVERWISF
jgi:hypothetical protein